MVLDLVILLIAGFLGGAVNSLAGGGSLITFPALIFVGMPPVQANATNTFSAFFGYLTGIYAFKDEFTVYKTEISILVFLSLLGGLLGAFLLLNITNKIFANFVPWLLLFAVILFSFGDKLNNKILTFKQGKIQSNFAKKVSKLSAYFAFLGISVYGGFFSAGLGILLLSYLSFTGQKNINAMNGIKLLISATIGFIAIAIFLYYGQINFFYGVLLTIGISLGGFVAAKVSLKVPQKYIKRFVIFFGLILTAYFFIA